METDDKSNRVIRTKPNAVYEAGDRTGRLPATLPLNYETFVKAYYGDDGNARQELIVQIDKGMTYLAENKIDSFETEKRVANSMTKHLGTLKIKDEKLTLGTLQAYLQHLRAKARVAKTNGDKTND